MTDITVEAGDSVSNGMTLAYIADTSAMEITQYFSYIYESEIYEGMEAAVSVPDSALSLTGTVTDISYVSYTTSTGLECFAVTVRVESPPASLTDGVAGRGVAHRQRRKPDLPRRGRRHAGICQQEDHNQRCDRHSLGRVRDGL